MLKLPDGYRAAGVHCGIKKSGKRDLALFVSDHPAAAAGVFTTNKVSAAPVKLCRSRIGRHHARAIVANSGNANACTGERGLRDARRMAAVTAAALGIEEDEVLVCSTGHIGRYLPMDRVEAGIKSAAASLSAVAGAAAAEAILTTDTRIKERSLTIEVGGHAVRITGVAKGSGMIAPHMATMLAFILTDAAVDADTLQAGLTDVVARTFNRITVDGDRSTNDSVLLLANGAAGNPELNGENADWDVFHRALEDVCMHLALEIVRDGEGATRLVTIRVRGAAHAADAERAARAVAESFLVKTSWSGRFVNWGRIMDALGYSGADMDEESVDISYDGVPAVRGGVAAAGEEDRLAQVVAGDEYTIEIDLHRGEGEAVIYSCNCTEEYVRINM